MANNEYSHLGDPSSSGSETAARPVEHQWQVAPRENPAIDLPSLVARLGTVPFFKGMPLAALKDIVFAGQLRHYPANSAIFREGDEAAGMHVLFRGQVNLCKVGLQGIEYIVHIIKPVIMFNETTVIDGLPNPVTAIACVDTTTWQVSAEDYQRLMKRYPEVGLGLLRILAKRNRALLARYEDLMSRPVLARTAKLLYSLSQCGQQPVNRYDHSNQKIAAIAGTVPEAISRSIKTLKENGVIECTRAQITILSIEALTSFALVDSSFLEYGDNSS